MKTILDQVLTAVSLDELRRAVDKARDYLLSLQKPQGNWCFTLEADTSLTSEYLMIRWLLGIWDPARASKAANFLWAKQGSDGGWPIYHGGPSDVSATVKAYFALKLCGFSAADSRMQKIRDKVKALGGVEACNVFTKYQLALFGQFPWQGTPSMPLEIFHLPKWFYFNLYNISYWSRTVLVPLLVILGTKPRCDLPPELALDELFLNPASKKSFRMPWSRPALSWKNFFLAIDKILKLFEKIPWKPWRARTLKKIENWILSRADKEGGLGAIFPAIANAVVALRYLGHGFDSPAVQSQWKEIEQLAGETENQFFLQPCFSPVWDTALAILALLESGHPADDPRLQLAAEWLLQKEVKTAGDWRVKNPAGPVGGWYFQFGNEYYPDVDDTAVVLMSLHRVKLSPSAETRKQAAMERAFRWLLSMQSRDGGWGAFDKNNNKMKLNFIPFADHGALLDPSTADVTARVVEAISRCRFADGASAAEKAVRFLAREQEKEGGWYGRWGVNYIYGTWSVLAALSARGFHPQHPLIGRAAAWLRSVQHSDGSWGESQHSYLDPAAKGKGKGTASQTAWALLALSAQNESPKRSASALGAAYLIQNQTPEGTWQEEEFTGTGFPRVFCLRYDGYHHLFPLWALGRLYQRWSSS